MRGAFEIWTVWACAVFVEVGRGLKSKIAVCDPFVEIDFGHDEDFVWQARGFAWGHASWHGQYTL